ncbi:MAG: transporter substrate-binding domain-containing protein, partial [Lentisphaerae bacterium]|nr:transporter substrate-binding domain-containing protein [Lentisphaerota bacterium]
NNSAKILDRIKDLRMKLFGRALFLRSDVVLLILPIITLIITGTSQARPVRVGVYDNPPKIMTGGDKKAPRGIFIDIVESVAEQEGWQITYVSGAWHDCLDRISKGDIDLMPDVAFSEERNLHFDFNKLPILSSWLQVFCRKDHFINSLAQLEGKKLTVLEGSIQQQTCKYLQNELGLSSIEIISLPEYASTISMVERGEADAVIASRFYGYSKERTDTLIPTPIILFPTSLYFITAKGRNAELLNCIDHHMVAMMNNPNSVYYDSLSRWLHKNPEWHIPRFIIYSISVISLIALLFVIFSLVLKRQVNNRTRELKTNNEKLRVSLQELEKAHEKAIKHERLHVLGQLISGIAHDFNNLLSPIFGCTDLMLEDMQELENVTDAKQNLLAIRNAASHGAELVRRMQDFCSNATRQAHKERIKINGIIDEAIELARMRWLYQNHSGNDRIKIIRDFGNDVEITGNKTELHEMILNLTLNAADAMPKGGKIEIATRNTGSEVIITIKDNGTGMPEEVRQECFKPFFSTKGDHGTGMGLAMVKSIVREHGGTVEIASSPGVGTVVTITFKAYKTIQ